MNYLSPRNFSSSNLLLSQPLGHFQALGGGSMYGAPLSRLFANTWMMDFGFSDMSILRMRWRQIMAAPSLADHSHICDPGKAPLTARCNALPCGR
jgi:hypothetical protein